MGQSKRNSPPDTADPVLKLDPFTTKVPTSANGSLETVGNPLFVLVRAQPADVVLRLLRPIPPTLSASHQLRWASDPVLDDYECAVMELTAVEEGLLWLYETHGRGGCIAYQHGGYCQTCKKESKDAYNYGPWLSRMVKKVNSDPYWTDSPEIDHDGDGFDPYWLHAQNAISHIPIDKSKALRDLSLP